MTPTASGAKSLPRASTANSLRAAAITIAAMLAQGVVARRPRMVELAGRLGTDRRAVRLLQESRHRYGPGPLRLRVMFRSVALVLCPSTCVASLEGSPEPFWPMRKSAGR